MYGDYYLAPGHSCNCNNCPGRNQWFYSTTYTIPNTSSVFYTPKHRKPGPAR